MDSGIQSFYSAAKTCKIEIANRLGGIEMYKEAVNTDGAPAAIGPYSQAIKAGDLLFTSGQIPLDSSGNLVSEDIKEQTAQCLNNLKNILEAAGSSLNKTIKTTVFLSDMGNFTAMNEVYSSFFASPFPARSCFQVARLPRDAKVEIELIASL